MVMNVSAWDGVKDKITGNEEVKEMVGDRIIMHMSIELIKSNHILGLEINAVGRS